MNIITKEEALDRFHGEEGLKKCIIDMCKRRCTEFIKGESCKQVYILLLTPDKKKFLVASKKIEKESELGNENGSIYLPTLAASLIRQIQEGTDLEFEEETIHVDSTYHMLAIGFSAIGMALKYHKNDETGEILEGSEEKIQGQIFALDFSFGKFFCVLEIPKEFMEEYTQDPEMAALTFENPDAEDIPEMEGRYNSLFTQSLNIYDIQEDLASKISKNPYSYSLNNNNDYFSKIEEEINKLEEDK